MRLVILLTLFISGCIVVESEKQTSWDTWDTATNSVNYGTGEDTSEDDVTDQGFYVLPNKVSPGDVLIANLRSTETINWSEISNITPYGALTVCAFQPLYDEILLTLKVLDTVETGTVDLVIEYIDGDVDLVEDAFTIDVAADIGSAEISNACE